MLAKVNSCAIVGLEGTIVEVEVDCSKGMPYFTLVGLPDAAVKESAERVRAALKNSGLQFPYARLTVNLAPADLRKVGPSYDLPIALGMLAASQQIAGEALDGALVLGELALDGAVRHVRGVLPMAALARDKGYKRIYVPGTDAQEATLVPGVEVVAVNTLAELASALNGVTRLNIVQHDTLLDGQRLLAARAPVTDFSEVKGQEVAKRALEVAAAGGHNCLLSGSPGSGKTLLARALPGILPDLQIEEALEVTRIYSVADMLPSDMPLVQTRPFRAPHHTISHAGLIGGGKLPRPGEVTLAHRGVLFLDEFPEFDLRALEVLRQPMEDRQVTISRAAGTLTFPANFMLVAAQNPCPCGWYGDPIKPCSCSPAMISRYQHKVSGPLLDRIDIHLDVTRVDYEKLTDARAGEKSEVIRARVQAARDRQAQRFAHTTLTCNADMAVADVRVHCGLDDAGRSLMKAAMSQLQLSARAFHRVLKLSRTIADLAGSGAIKVTHLAEALQYRPRRQEM
jgi:magnesium chelatase family protein